ncbi:MAG: InlB B-repeat-containing protein [Acholeplasma sp.]|nr:InlB B-repeat-containing protein [Acholeplasma sp.]
MRKRVLVIMVLLLGFLSACTGDKTITVKFETNGGSELADLTIKTTDKTINLPEPTKDGYEFVDWYTDEGLTTPFSISVLLTQSTTITLYAKWNPIEASYTVAFQSNGGTTVETATYLEGATISAPVDPEKEGFIFDGWYSDEALTTVFVFSTMPANNLTLYAKWTPEQFTITYETNGGSVIQSESHEAGVVLNEPIAPTKTGYQFAGWFTDELLTTVYVFTSMPSNNLTLYAKWTPAQFTITYQTNGGSLITEEEQDFGSQITVPEAPYKVGHDFEGWYSDEALTTVFAFSTMPANNITLYAKWVVKNFTISFEENGGETLTDLEVPYQGVMPTMPVPIKEGYRFVGWFIDEAFTTAFTQEVMADSNIDLFAKYEINEYTIKITSQGSLHSTILLTFGTEITLPTMPEVLGYTFKGFYEDDGLFETLNMPARDVDLEAVYQVNQYEISFGNLELTPIKVDFDALISLSEPTKLGFVFLGWFTDESLKQPFLLAQMPAMNIELYAKFDYDTYTLNLDVEGEITSVLVDYKAQYDLPILEKEGFKFDGWYEEADYQTKVVFFTMPANDKTLYAKFVLDDGYTNFDAVLVQEPLTEVKIKGVITYIMAEETAYGFYLSDGLMYLYVHEFATGFSVGDTVELFGYYLPINGHPAIRNIRDMNLIEETYPAIETIVITEEALETMDSMSVYAYINKFRISGFIVEEEGQLYLTNTLGDLLLHLAMGSYEYSAISAYLNTYVSVEFYFEHISDTDEFDRDYHIRIDSDSIETIPLTDQEKIDLMLESAQMINETDFYSRYTLELPTTDGMFGTTLLFETVGVNKDYFNVETGMFMPTEVDRVIELNCTITLNEVVVQTTFYLHLKADIFVTPNELSGVDDHGYVSLTGIVYQQLPQLGITLVMDEFAVVVVYTSMVLDRGDEIVVSGYKESEPGVAFVYEGDENSTRLISKNNPLPQAFTPITTLEFMSLDVEYDWLKPKSITGVLTAIDGSPMLSICSEGACVELVIMDEQTVSMLSAYVGLEVTIHGLTFPAMSEEPKLSLLMSSNPSDVVVLPLSDEQMVLLGLNYIEYLFDNPNYQPGETVDLVTQHPLYSELVFTYETFQIEAIDLTTGMIDASISEPMSISLSITVTYKTIVETKVITLWVNPLGDFVKIADILVSGVTNQVKLEVIVMSDLVNGLLIVADETGMMYLYTSNNLLSRGDMVTIEGYYDFEFDYFINDSSDAVVSVDGFTVSLPQNYLYSVIDFVYEDFSTLGAGFVWVTLQGTLNYDSELDKLFIVGYQNAIEIQVIDEFAKVVLSYESGNEVRITGYAIGSKTINQFYYLNQYDDFEILENSYDELDSIAYLNIDTFNKFALPGSELFFDMNYSGDLTYNIEAIGDNAHLYDPITHLVSTAITENLSIGFRLTLTLGELTKSYEFDVLIINTTGVSISTIKSGDHSIAYFLEAIVVYPQTNEHPMIVADETGYMFVLGQHNYHVGDLLSLYGTIVYHEGLPALNHDVQATLLSSGQSIPIDPISLTLTEFYQFNVFTDLYASYVEISGYIDQVEGRLVISDQMFDGYYVPLAYTYREADLYDYMHVKVTIRGFIVWDEFFEENGLLFSGDLNEFSLNYENDAAMMTDLIQMANYYYGQTHHPYQMLDMPTYFDPFEASIVFSVISGQDYLDAFNQILTIDTAVTIELQAEITIGGLTEITTFTVAVEPYVIEDVSDLVYKFEGETAYIAGIVIHTGEDYFILQDQTGLVYVNSYDAVTVGDEVVVLGQVYFNSRSLYVDQRVEESHLEITSQSNPVVINPEVETIQSFYELFYNQEIPMYYATFSGRFIFQNNTFYLTDDINKIIIESDVYMDETLLSNYIDQFVSVSLVYLGTSYEKTELGHFLLMNAETDLKLYEGTNAEKANIILSYARGAMSFTFRPNMTYQIPLSYPDLGGTITVVNSGIYSELFMVDNQVITIADITDYYYHMITIKVTYEDVLLEEAFEIYMAPYEINSILHVISIVEQEQEAIDYYIQGVIVGVDLNYDSFVYVYDGSGVIFFIEMENTLAEYIGHEIILQGSFEQSGGDLYIAYDYKVEWISQQYVGLDVPQYVDFPYIYMDGNYNTQETYSHLELTGIVEVRDNAIYLVGEVFSDEIELVSNQSGQYTNLFENNGQIVTVSGILLGQMPSYEGDMPTIAFILFDQPIETL